MLVEEAKMAVKTKALVGTSNIQVRGGICLYSTGYLVEMVKVKVRGKKEEHFRFRDRWGEVEVIRPASEFSFAE